MKIFKKIVNLKKNDLIHNGEDSYLRTTKLLNFVYLIEIIFLIIDFLYNYKIIILFTSNIFVRKCFSYLGFIAITVH